MGRHDVTIVVKKLDLWTQAYHNMTQWKTFKLPLGETINCYKARDLVEDFLPGGLVDRDWGPNIRLSSALDPGKVGSDGVAHGTPMQLGRAETRVVTWGSGYGRTQQIKHNVNLPLLGNRYWITGYPVTMFDKRCIVVAPNGEVHELIQFDQDASVMPAGFPQQALNLGTWRNGELIYGKATTAADLPSHAHIWGPGSLENPHCQAFTVQDYLGADGSDGFAAKYGPDGSNDGPKAGDWYYLVPGTPSYVNMVAKGGQCEARAEALATYGARLIDRGSRTSFLTQAGTWAKGTNIHEFRVNLNDLTLITEGF
jgi:hypothetical protein